MCKRACIYKASFGATTMCNYAFQTGRTRTVTIADLYGIDPHSPEHRELMKPKNCPLFEPSRRRRIVEDPYGIKKVKKVKTYKPPADEKLLFDLYCRGLSDLAIARQAGTTENKVRWWRYKKGFNRHKAAEQ